MTQDMSRTVTPFFADDWLTLYGGDCREVLASLPADSVDCVVTSPPYWGLRDYGHDGQLGLERTPEEYVVNMVGVFAEVRRVLKSSGTCWLNLGDSYAGSRAGAGDTSTDNKLNTRSRGVGVVSRRRDDAMIPRSDLSVAGLKRKDLVGIPWRVAFALQAEGWYLRSDVIWSKPNPMPESVTDRPTKSHDSLHGPVGLSVGGKQAAAGATGNASTRRRQTGFNARWDESERVQTRRAIALAREHGLTEAHIDAIRRYGIADSGKAVVTQNGNASREIASLVAEAKAALGGYFREFLLPATRNARSVWTIPTRPYADAHFAVFPPELPERCIKAGSPEGGVILDPFGGSGTVGMVANRLSRRAILIDLNPEYLKQQMKRNAQAPLGLSEVSA